MKGFVFALSLVAICCGPVSAEDGESQQQRRRPRIRVYDESPRLIPVTRESENNQTSRQEMDRRIRQDRPLSTGLQAPGGAFSHIPSLIEPQWNPPQNDSSEDQESSWINPLEFLSEEDLYDVEGSGNEASSDNQQPEIEISAWEDLQAEMFKQTMSSRSDEKMTMEELAELTVSTKEESDDRKQAGGLDLSPVAPVDTSDTFNEVSTSGTESRERTDVSLFTPILRMEPRGGDIPPGSGSDRGEPVEFSGSRELFNRVKENREPVARTAFQDRQSERTFARPQFEPVEAPTLHDRSRSAALPGAGSALPGAGFGRGDALPDSRPMPGDVRNSRPSPGATSESGSSQRETERFRTSEYRIRSQLDPAGGRGF